MNWQERAAQLWCKPENARTVFDSTLCGTIAEALEKAYKQGYKDADKAIACEYRDPNGTIWEWCEKVQKNNTQLMLENEELRKHPALSIDAEMAIKVGNMAIENDRLEALVDTIYCIAGKPYDFSGKTDMWKVAGDLSDDCQDIMDKIAEFKEGK